MPTKAEKDYAYWEEQFDTLRRGQLTTVQTSAGNWAKAVTALLGVLGTVTFATGETALSKLPKDRDIGWLHPAHTLAGDVKLLIVIAFVLALAAAALVSLASGEIFPRSRPNDSPTKLRNRTLSTAKKALIELRIGQGLGVAAILIVLAGSLVVFLTPATNAPTEPPTVVAVTTEGVFCGKLQGTAAALTVAGHSLNNVSAMTVVTACPEG
jgi:hypothetical protein